MKAVIQRVSEAKVDIAQEERSAIKKGIVILLGIVEEDTAEDIEWLSRKIANMRIFDDKNGQMNLSVKDIDREIMVISQFTLYASTKKGNRPSYINAAKPGVAEPLYEDFIKELGKQINQPIQTGEFGADMQISLCNDGPVTIIIDSKNKA